MCVNWSRGRRKLVLKILAWYYSKKKIIAKPCTVWINASHQKPFYRPTAACVKWLLKRTVIQCNCTCYMSHAVSYVRVPGSWVTGKLRPKLPFKFQSILHCSPMPKYEKSSHNGTPQPGCSNLHPALPLPSPNWTGPGSQAEQIKQAFILMEVIWG